MNRLEKEALNEDLKGAGLDALFSVLFYNKDIDKVLYMLRVYRDIKLRRGRMRYSDKVKEYLRDRLGLATGYLNMDGFKSTKSRGMNRKWDETRDMEIGEAHEAWLNEAIDSGPTYLDQLCSL